MSDDRPAALGIDMVPEHVPAWAVVKEAPAIPATEAERDESVNADVLRRVCHLSVQELIRHVRGLPPEAPIVVGNLVRLTAQELQAAVERYLAVERRCRNVRR